MCKTTYFDTITHPIKISSTPYFFCDTPSESIICAYKKNFCCGAGVFGLLSPFEPRSPGISSE